MKNRGHSTTETFIEWIVGIIIIAILFGAFLFGADKAFDNYEKQYCFSLQAQAEQYRNFSLSIDNPGGFYITQLDKEQCDSLGIKIKAPVR